MQCNYSCIACICLIFLHCASSNVSSNYLDQRMRSRTGCICLTFLHCVFSYVSSKNSGQSMQSHTGYICLPFLHCVYSNVFSKRLYKRMHSHIGCTCLTFWSFSSGFPHHSINSHNFDKFVPLCCVLSKWSLQTDSNQ